MAVDSLVEHTDAGGGQAIYRFSDVVYRDSAQG
jgi:hypothetical protein